MRSSEPGLIITAADLALKDTLELLEWPRLCEYLSTFASTAQGCRACNSLSLPMDLENSRRRIAETVEVGTLDQLTDGGINFQGVHDMEHILIRCLKGGVASGEDLLQVANTLGAARRLRRQVEEPLVRPFISSLFVDLATLPELEKLLKFGIEEGGRVADRASDKLRALRNKWQAMRVERRVVLQDLIRRKGSILQDTAIADRNSRPVLALKAGAVDQIPGIVHGSSASGNTIFLEPQVVIPLGNRINSIESEVAIEEHRLLSEWSGVVKDHYVPLEHLARVILELDMAFARARFGHWLGGVPPMLYDEIDAPFVLNQLRHPLLVCQQLRENGHVVVPVSIEVSSHLRVVAITGPNTGGKTVTLKSIGLAALMARAGLLLPCSGNPSLPWCNQVLADIGDEQSLQQNLSTFSSHITRIARILQSLKELPGPSLVLLDEVGAGTDPSEGTALATALLCTLAETARLTIATTHLGGLKSLKYRDSRFENASVAFDSETIQPTYHLQWGIPGRSNALEIARRLGLDLVVIKRAQELVSPEGLDDINNVIRGLEAQRKRQQTAAEESAALLARTEILHEKLLLHWQRQSEQSAEFKEHGRKQVEHTIRQGQKEVRSLISRLRKRDADGETARRIGQKLRRLEIDYQPTITEKQHHDWSPKVGDRVRLIALGKAGEVIEISEDGLQLTVLCGIFRSIVSLKEVESVDGRKPHPTGTVVEVKTSHSIRPSSAVRTKRNTLDVRGLRVHEAEAVVEEHLRNTTGPLWVIHGIGTGKLKRGLREWLSTIPYVERVTDADQHDGGAGCSVVWLQ